jgi:hypothetical protein
MPVISVFFSAVEGDGTILAGITLNFSPAVAAPFDKAGGWTSEEDI